MCEKSHLIFGQILLLDSKVYSVVEDAPGKDIDVVLGGGRGSFTPAEYEVIRYYYYYLNNLFSILLSSILYLFPKKSPIFVEI